MKSVRDKKFLSLLLMIILMLLSGCASGEERDKARSIEVLAEPIIKQYVEENYSEYEVEKLGNIYEQNVFKSYATTFVKATVSKEINDVEKETFNLIYDTEKNRMYSDVGSEESLTAFLEKFEVGEDGIKTAKFICKELESLQIDTTNFYDTANKNEDNYIIFCELKGKDPSIPDKLYETIKTLGNSEYRFRVILGENATEISTTFKLRDISIKDVETRHPCKMIGIVSKAGTIREEVMEVERIDLGTNYLLYDSTLYNIEATLSDTAIGSRESTESSNDYKITATLKQKALENEINTATFNVFSGKYRKVVCSNIEESKEQYSDMNVFGMISFIPTYYTEVEVETTEGTGEILVAFYNEIKAESTQPKK